MQFVVWRGQVQDAHRGGGGQCRSHQGKEARILRFPSPSRKVCFFPLEMTCEPGRARWASSASSERPWCPEASPASFTRAGLHAPKHLFSPDSHAGLTSALNVSSSREVRRQESSQSHGPHIALVFVDGRDGSRRHSQTFCMYRWEGDPYNSFSTIQQFSSRHPPHDQSRLVRGRHLILGQSTPKSAVHVVEVQVEETVCSLDVK